MAKLEKVIRELMLKNKVLNRAMNEIIDSVFTGNPVALPKVDKYLLKGFLPTKVKGRHAVIAKAKKLRCKGCYDRIVEVKQLKREGQFYFNCLFVSHHNDPYRVEIWDISVGMIAHERTRVTNLRTGKQFEKLIKDGTVTGWIPAFLNRLSWPVIEKAFKVLKKLEAK